MRTLDPTLKMESIVELVSELIYSQMSEWRPWMPFLKYTVISWREIFFLLPPACFEFLLRSLSPVMYRLRFLERTFHFWDRRRRIVNRILSGPRLCDSERESGTWVGAKKCLLPPPGEAPFPPLSSSFLAMSDPLPRAPTHPHPHLQNGGVERISLLWLHLAPDRQSQNRVRLVSVLMAALKNS